MDLLICGVCDEKFHLIDKFVQHKKTLPVFRCTNCTSLFHSKEELEKHIDNTHQMGYSQIDNKVFLGSVHNLIQGQKTCVLDPSICNEDHLEDVNRPVLKRRPGRPRKTVASADDISRESEELTFLKAGSAVIEADAAGLFRCKQCNRAFKKERHIKSHRCLDDIQAQDLTQNAAELNPLANESDEDRSADFRVHMTLDRPPWFRKRRKMSNMISSALEQDIDSKDLELPNGKEKEDSGPCNLPVFNTEDERLTFEDHLSSINLDCVASMYISHDIPQEVQTSSPLKNSKNISKNLKIYSCITCKKVFKKEAHIRVHCLSHTELKPFSCQQCEFSTKTKGNLSTHMRWHTGNLFKCNQCPFQTGNKNHLQEHEATHSTLNQKCKLCRSSYKTLKSLRNHVHRYHVGPSGKKYLDSFASKTQERSATIHLCDICNKKFKNKFDRDHHQEKAHEISPDVSLNKLLDQNPACDNIILKEGNHRLVFVCCVCQTVHLNQELLRNHLEDHLIEKKDNRLSGSFGIEFIREGHTCSLSDNPVHESVVNNNLSVTSCSSFTSRSIDVSDSGIDLSRTENYFFQESSPVSETSILSSVRDSETRVSNELPNDPIQTAILSANLEALFEKSIGTQWYLSEAQFPLIEGHSENNTTGKGLLRTGGDVSDNDQKDIHISSTPKKKPLKVRPSQKCPYCDRLFKRSSKDLQRHLYIHQKKQGFRPIACKPSVTDVSTTTYLCDQCGATFTTEALLVSHCKSHMTSYLTPSAPLTSGHICDEEELTVPSIDTPGVVTNKHTVDEDEQVYNCLSCNSAYSNFTEILSHLKEQHGIAIDASDLGVQVDNEENRITIEECVLTPEDQNAQGFLEDLTLT